MRTQQQEQRPLEEARPPAFLTLYLFISLPFPVQVSYPTFCPLFSHEQLWALLACGLMTPATSHNGNNISQRQPMACVQACMAGSRARRLQGPQASCKWPRHRVRLRPHTAGSSSSVGGSFLGAGSGGPPGNPPGTPMVCGTPARSHGGASSHLGRASRGGGNGVAGLEAAERLPPSPSDPQMGMDLRKTALLRSLLLRTEVLPMYHTALVLELSTMHSHPCPAGELLCDN